ncbi:MAG TPA: bifunctional riboflavin kinase/FAD synthetase [Thermodesulfobacteriota bacterium]|nr:bifunctional riboflavin kinase/FAD synthetase [Thermodesulfobacteriota bacterium]
MKIIFDPEKSIEFSTSATIGVFDGVHLGHKKIIGLVQRGAGQKSLSSCIVTFNPHPQKVIRGTDMPLIVPLRERFKLLEKEGVDITVCYTFTKEFASISAKDFVSDILVRKLKVKSLFIGPDFFFGKGREGNTELLKVMERDYGFETNVVSPASLNGEIISSTIIRKLIEDGMVKKAARFLDKNFSMEGKIKEGEKRGRKLGFPTANLDTDWELLPKRGVYATWAHLSHKRLRSITNIGFRPTFGENRLLIETHIIDFKDNLYGEPLRVEFIDRLRDERRFESVDALVAQISRDVERAKEIFSQLGQDPHF